MELGLKLNLFSRPENTVHFNWGFFLIDLENFLFRLNDFLFCEDLLLNSPFLLISLIYHRFFFFLVKLRPIRLDERLRVVVRAFRGSLLVINGWQGVVVRDRTCGSEDFFFLNYHGFFKWLLLDFLLFFAGIEFHLLNFHAEGLYNSIGSCHLHLLSDDLCITEFVWGLKDGSGINLLDRGCLMEHVRSLYLRFVIVDGIFMRLLTWLIFFLILSLRHESYIDFISICLRSLFL